MKKRARSQKRLTLGLLIESFWDGYQGAIWHGVADLARERDVNLICFNGGRLGYATANDIDGQRNILYELVTAENVDGLIVAGSSLIGRARVETLKSFCDRYRPLPIVNVGMVLEDVPSVLVNGEKGLHDEIKHLIEVHGYRRIAFIRGSANHKEAEQRYSVYQQVLAECGLPFDPDLVAQGSFAPATGAAAMRDWLERGVDIEAVVAANDHMAIGALEELQAHGKRVPEDVAIAGFDDWSTTVKLIHRLTTVRQPTYQLGYTAAELALKLIAGEDTPAQIDLPTELVVRRSCGCKSAATARAMTGVVEPNHQELEVCAAQRQTEIVAEMAQIPGLTTEAAEQLLKRFVFEMKGEVSGLFLQTIEDLISQALAAGTDVAAWQNALSILRKHLLPTLIDKPTVLARADDLWQQARVAISEGTQRVQAYQEVLAEQQAQTLREIDQALISTFDVQGLMDVLAKQLPRLGIPSAYLALYEDSKVPTAESRLMLAYHEQGQIDVEPGGRLFTAPQLVPMELRPQGRSTSYVAEPLYFREDQIGFALFEAGPMNGSVYEALRGGISSALQGAMLVKHVQERSAEIVRQQYILDTFMESVPDRIYFKDNESRFTRANKALIQKVGLPSAEELIGKSDFDFFPAEQAQQKYQEEQEIMRSGRPILSLQEADGVDLWASTTKMPLRDENGQIIGTFGISRDITELVRANQVAEKAKEAAETAQRSAESEKAAAEAAREEAVKARRDTEAANQNLAAQMWQTTGQAQLNDRMRGEQDITTLAGNVIKQLCHYLNAQVGALYVLDNEALRLAGTYAYRRKNLIDEFRIGEGPIGEAALDCQPKIIALPDHYVTGIFSNTGEVLPQHILIAPFAYERQTIGVIEIEALNAFTPAQMNFLNQALENIAVGFTTAQARRHVNELLAKTQQQAGELQAQEEELRAANEELASQAENLRASEAKLRANQAELETVNVELEEKAAALQEQQQLLDRQNQDLRVAQQELKQQADELALASKYKSEFLANMSHELRTPLNSLLILAGMLAKNEQGNLTDDQVESAQIICSGGTDLLNLINDILDLSKVEAGRMEFRYAPMPLMRLIDTLRAQFTPLAEGKDFEFVIQVADDLPAAIETDQQRVEQIVKNLLSNAFKFTHEGQVCLRVYRPAADTDLSKSGLQAEHAVAISVADTGIGMTPEQQKIVFEAFQQADGSTSRQYGGTGLGLSISRELAARLGGQIDLVSAAEQGSTFTLYLPIARPGQPASSQTPAVSSAAATPAVKAPTILQSHEASSADAGPLDDRAVLRAGDRVLLIVEDDLAFARVVQDYGRRKNFKCLVAATGQNGLNLARRHKPDAIILDLNLPDISGWEVLDQLKHDPDTLHIPVHIITAQEESLDAFKRGAMGFLTKPIGTPEMEGAFQTIEQFIARKIKSLLIVEDDDNLRKSVRKLLEGSDVNISEANTGEAALTALGEQHFDCMILDLTLPDMSGFALLNRLNGEDHLPKCPVIVYTGKALSEEENQELMKYADSVIVKGAKSPERLLDEAALFLHRVVADMPEEKQRMIKRLLGTEGALTGKAILIVDDDARNAFALSKLLADKGLKVHIAPNGAKALEALDRRPIDLVLMDIMLPGMDGYEITRRIRAQARFRPLPILALTAKAMKGDREKCLEAGANDYLAKPVDIDRLLSMLRVWLSKE